MKPRQAIIMLVVGLLPVPEPSVRAGEFQTAPLVMAAAIGNSSTGVTNAPSKVPAAKNQVHIEPGKKRKARFFGAFGMIIISLLALATAIALLHSIRPH